MGIALIIFGAMSVVGLVFVLLGFASEKQGVGVEEPYRTAALNHVFQRFNGSVILRSFEERQAAIDAERKKAESLTDPRWKAAILYWVKFYEQRLHREWNADIAYQPRQAEAKKFATTNPPT